MELNIMDFIKGYFKRQGVQLLCLNPPFSQLESVDYHFHQKMHRPLFYEDTKQFIDKQMNSGLLYHVEDEFRLFYSFYKVPEPRKELCQTDVICLGPLLFRPITPKLLEQLMEESHISKEWESDLKEYINRIPMPGPFDNWEAVTAYFFSFLAGGPVETQTILYKDLPQYHHSYVNYAITSPPNVAMKSIEERYHLENDLLNAVSVGNTEQALALHLQFKQYKLTPRTADPVRQRKNFLIIFNTLLRKSAENGHVHPLHIDNLSTQIAIQIETMFSISALDSYSMTMIRKYCMLVKNYSRRSYSSLIQTCLDYIDFHYAEDLSLDLMAKLCSVSSTYLSSLFKKEVSMTLTDYINSTRIRQSLILLNTTSLSVQEIALHCGFSDSNYYTRTFKKFQGQSPKGYRETIRRGGKQE